MKLHKLRLQRGWLLGVVVPAVTVRKCLSQSFESRQSPGAHGSSLGAGLSCGRGGQLMCGDHHPLYCPPALPNCLVMLKDHSPQHTPWLCIPAPTCTRTGLSLCIIHNSYCSCKVEQEKCWESSFPMHTLPAGNSSSSSVAHTSRPGIRQLLNVQVTCSSASCHKVRLFAQHCWFLEGNVFRLKLCPHTICFSLIFSDKKAEYIMSTWLSWCYIRLWFCVRFAVSELLSGSCDMLLLLFSSGESVTKINTIFIAIMNVTHRLFLGWPQASIICLRAICKYWLVLQIICSHFIWNLKVLQFCSLRSVWYQRYSYKSQDPPRDTIDSQGCWIVKIRCFRGFLAA